MPELPSYMAHIEGGQPVVFYFKEKKPEEAILPTYIMRKDKNELMPTVTLRKSSRSERKKEVERSLLKSAKTQTPQSLSAKQSLLSSTTPASSSSSLAIKKIEIEKDAAKMMTLEANVGEKSEKRTTILAKVVDEKEGYYLIGIF